MLACMVTSTGILIPLFYTPRNDLFSGQCDTIIGIQDEINTGNNTDIINPLWNCKSCQASEGGFVRCTDPPNNKVSCDFVANKF